MKKIIVFILSVIFFTSCEKTGLIQESKEEPLLGYDCIPNKHIVSINDVKKIVEIRHRYSYTKSSQDAILNFDLAPIVRGGDTLLYVVNYRDGWELISSDDRMPIVLAKSEKGKWSEDFLSGSTGLLINNYIFEIQKLRTLCDSNQFVAKWPDLGRQEFFLTKGDVENHDGEVLQLVWIDYEQERLEYIPRMILTRWGQDAPWNSCTPVCVTGNKSKVGCAAVAAAQFEKYWHDHFGTPAMTYEYGVNESHTADSLRLYGLSSSIWDRMPNLKSSSDTLGIRAAAALMARIGRDIDMRYGENVSSSYFHAGLKLNSLLCSDSIPTMYKEHSLAAYNTMISTIRSGIPVIVDMVPSNGSSILHTAIVNGMYHTRDKYTYYYQWMPIGVEPPVEWSEPNKSHPEDYVISDPFYENEEILFVINWGENGSNDLGRWSLSCDYQPMPSFYGNTYTSFNYYIYSPPIEE